ncbi:hypothetical protein VTK73DRAFT_3800 [Phialemonium thermophilum]|uniref:Uncharacterized protein n=1 Tax=Phialemonium thermophilum TaxID=223376 RepID=A0ABR3VG68_9PEZI
MLAATRRCSLLREEATRIQGRAGQRRRRHHSVIQVFPLLYYLKRKKREKKRKNKHSAARTPPSMLHAHRPLARTTPAMLPAPNTASRHAMPPPQSWEIIVQVENASSPPYSMNSSHGRRKRGQNRKERKSRREAKEGPVSRPAGTTPRQAMSPCGNRVEILVSELRYLQG